jgi:hypothetical protein
MATRYILWPLCCLSVFDLRFLITSLVSCGHCVVCPSSIYGFWWPFWYLVAIVLSVLRFTASDYLLGILWPLCCLSFFDLRLLITFDRVTRTPLKTRGELMCSGRISSSCSTSGTRRVTLVTYTAISHEWGKDRKVLTTSETYPWSFMTQIFRNV